MKNAGILQYHVGERQVLSTKLWYKTWYLIWTGPNSRGTLNFYHIILFLEFCSAYIRLLASIKMQEFSVCPSKPLDLPDSLSHAWQQSEDPALSKCSQRAMHALLKCSCAERNSEFTGPEKREKPAWTCLPSQVLRELTWELFGIGTGPWSPVNSLLTDSFPPLYSVSPIQSCTTSYRQLTQLFWEEDDTG